MTNLVKPRNRPLDCLYWRSPGYFKVKGGWQLTTCPAVLYKVISTNDWVDVEGIGKVVVAIRQASTRRTFGIRLGVWVDIPVALGVLDIDPGDTSVRKLCPAERVNVV